MPVGRRAARAGGTNTRIDEALEIYRDLLAGGHWRIPGAEMVRADCLVELGRYAEAETVFRTAYRALASSRGAEAPRTLEVAERLADLFQTVGPARRGGRARARLP